MKIPVIMQLLLDQELSASVAVLSIMKNGTGYNEYIFYFLVKSKAFNIDSELFDKLKEEFTNFSYEYILSGYNEFWNIIQQYDKYLYVNTDVVVQCDIAELFSFNIEQYYFAAVKDINMLCNRKRKQFDHLEEDNSEAGVSCCDTGLFVLNAKRIRDENIGLDREILNKDIFFLPIQYNVCNNILQDEDFYNCGALSRAELELIKKEKNFILSYKEEQDKPWKYPMRKKADIWWKYAHQLPDIDWVKRKCDEMKESANRVNIAVQLVSRCASYKHVILYGYTNISKQLLVFLEENNVNNVRFFCDASSVKIGERFHDKICISVDDLLPIITEEYLFVICSQKAYVEIEDDLVSFGVKKRNVVRYLKRTKQYYLDLDKKYYDKEMWNIYQEVLKTANPYTEKLRNMGYKEFCVMIKSMKNYAKYEDIYIKYKFEDWYIEEYLVTIIIPAYNAEKYIGRCLESIWMQEYKNWECIIINDGSQDYTEQLVNKWCQKDYRFHVYSQRNMGMGVARNRAISMAKGKYITFVDADDWIEPDYIKLMIRTLLRKTAQVCKCNFRFHDILQNNVYEAGVTEEIDILDEKTYIYPNLWGNMFERSLFTMHDIKMPGIPLEDLAIYPLLLLMAKKVVGVDKPLYNYQINSGKSIMDNAENARYYPEAVEYLLREADRLRLRVKYADLFKAIVCRHMLGGLNSRIKSSCSEEEYGKVKKNWCYFLTKKFPSCSLYNGFHRIWAWGSYNIPQILANIKTYEGYNIRTTGLPYYFGYSSTISLMDRKVIENDLKSDDAFFDNMLKKENCHYFLDVKPEEQDILVLDLLEERWDLIRCQADGWLTKNDIRIKYLKLEMDVLKRNSAECMRIGKLAVQKFYEFITKKFKRQNIYLVENYYVPKLKISNDWMLKWEGINETNEILRRYYDYLKKIMPDIKIITIPENLNYTDGSLNYATTPAYLNEMAYKLMAKKLEEMIISRDRQEI